MFASGMALVDTLDNVLMVGAYGWAFSKPQRKLYYNMTITGTSVVVALFIGGLEALGLLMDKFALSGGIWRWGRGVKRQPRRRRVCGGRAVCRLLGAVGAQLSLARLR
jgi:high-affinity nickel-transport protein